MAHAGTRGDQPVDVRVQRDHRGEHRQLPRTRTLVSAHHGRADLSRGRESQDARQARINNAGSFRRSSRGVGRRFFEFVFRVKVVFDWLIVLMGVVTVLLVAVSILSTRLRRAELETLEKIGASAFRRRLSRCSLSSPSRLAC